MKVNVCIPVLKRYDLLRGLLLSLYQSTVKPNRVYIINNGDSIDGLNQAISGISLPFIFTKSTSPLHSDACSVYGLAKSWNWFIERTRGEERIIANDDIEFGSNSLELMLSSPADIVFPVGIGFSCFLIRDSCVDKIGLFDETLSPGFAYFEDCDYMNRVVEYNSRNPNSPISTSDIPDTGVFHHRNGTQKAIASREEATEFRKKYYIAQENYLIKWKTLPVGLRRMNEEECFV